VSVALPQALVAPLGHPLRQAEAGPSPAAAAWHVPLQQPAWLPTHPGAAGHEPRSAAGMDEGPLPWVPSCHSPHNHTQPTLISLACTQPVQQIEAANASQPRGSAQTQKVPCYNICCWGGWSPLTLHCHCCLPTKAWAVPGCFALQTWAANRNNTASTGRGSEVQAEQQRVAAIDKHLHTSCMDDCMHPIAI